MQLNLELQDQISVKFELDWSASGNEKCGRTDGRRTHQSNRQVGYMQPA